MSDNDHDEKSEKKQKFTVTDRRKVSGDDASEAEAKADAAPAADAARAPGEDAGVQMPDDGGEAPIDFGSFVISLGTSAYVSMGKVENPETGEHGVDLPAAKQLIDILQMLRDKTEGNLQTDEQQLLKGLLYELRLAYVEARNAHSS